MGSISAVGIALDGARVSPPDSSVGRREALACRRSCPHLQKVGGLAGEQFLPLWHMHRSFIVSSANGSGCGIVDVLLLRLRGLMFERRPGFFRAEDAPSPARRADGRVKWFNATKGFGF